MKKFLVIAAVIIFISVLGMIFLPGLIIKHSIEKFGSTLFQTDLDVGEIDLEYFDDTLELKNVTLANPPGFRLEHALEIGSIKVSLQESSFFSNRLIHIKSVEITDVTGNIELGLNGYNYSELYKKYGVTYKSPFDDEDNGGSARWVRTIINNLSATNNKIMVYQAAPIGKPKQTETIPIGDIDMQDIGKDYDLSFADAVTDVLLQASYQLPANFKRPEIQTVLDKLRYDYRKNFVE